MTTAVMSEAQTATSYQRQLFNAHRERQKRFAAAAKKAMERPANTNAVVAETAPIKARQIPMWVQGCCFDAHITAYRLWLVSEVHRLKDGDLAGSVRDKKPVYQILDEVLAQFPGVTVREVKGMRRNKRLIRPRQLAVYEVWSQRDDLSLPAIGRLFNRDHTTILSSIRKIEAEKAAQLLGAAE